MNLAEIEIVIEAKNRRDVVRDQIVRAVRDLPFERLTVDLISLLRADDIAADGLSAALYLAAPAPEIAT